MNRIEPGTQRFWIRSRHSTLRRSTTFRRKMRGPRYRRRSQMPHRIFRPTLSNALCPLGPRGRRVFGLSVRPEIKKRCQS